MNPIPKYPSAVSSPSSRRPRAALAGLLAAAGCALLLAGGCRTPSAGPQTPPASAKKAAAPSPTTAPSLSAAVGLAPSALPPAKLPKETPLNISEIVPKRALGVKDERILPERKPIRTPEVKIAGYPDKLIKGIADPDKSITVTLSLDATPLPEVVELFSKLLHFDYYIDPAIKGAVTMNVDTKMTARETWQLFEHILWLAGAYASRNPGFIHILPFSKMPKERRLLVQHGPAANVEVAFIPIYHTKSSEIAGLIKPFTTDGASVTDIPRLNTLLIVEAPANMEKLRELIKRLDTPGEAEWPQICVRCHEVDVEDVADDLKALLPVLGFPVTDSKDSGGRIKIVALPRLQAIVASAALQSVLDEVERWIHVLDKKDESDQESIYFYNVKHSTADHLNEALSVFFNSSGVTSTAPSRTRSISAKGTADKNRPARSTSRYSSRSRSRRTATRRPGESQKPKTIFDQPIVVYADTEQNRLTIRATPRVYAMVKALLERLDIPARQVVIQATIAEITLNKSTEFGFSYAARRLINRGPSNLKAAVVNTKVLDSNRLVDAIDSGVAFLFKRNDDELAFIRAVAGDTNVRVLSAPQVIATSDQEAVINVGNRVPVITGDYTDISGTSTTTGSTYRNIQYQDTGIILTVTPHITAGNEVQLEVKQEVSDAVKTESSNIDSPTIQKREIDTVLSIPDGDTALLGGLIQTRTDNSRSGVPWLMKLPGLGALFRTNTNTSKRTELLVLITANVIQNQSATDKLVQRYKEALAEIRKQLQQ